MRIIRAFVDGEKTTHGIVKHPASGTFFFADIPFLARGYELSTRRFISCFAMHADKKFWPISRLHEHRNHPPEGVFRHALYHSEWGLSSRSALSASCSASLQELLSNIGDWIVTPGSEWKTDYVRRRQRVIYANLTNVVNISSLLYCPYPLPDLLETFISNIYACREQELRGNSATFRTD
jgi:hypothetical protein